MLVKPGWRARFDELVALGKGMKGVDELGWKQPDVLAALHGIVCE